MTAFALIARYMATPAPALSFRRPLELHVGMLLRSKRLGGTYQIVAIHGDQVTVQLYRRRNREMYGGRVRMSRAEVAERMESP